MDQSFPTPEHAEQSSPASETTTHTAWTWCALLVVATLLNVVQFESAQAALAKRFHTFATWRGDLLASGRRETTIVKKRYEVPLTLALRAPGSTIILPKNRTHLDNDFLGQLDQWGKVRKIQFLNYDPKRLLAELDIKKNVLAHGSDHGGKWGKRAYVLIARAKHDRAKLGKTDAREFIFIKRGSKDVLVDTSLVKAKVNALKRRRVR